MLRYEGEYIGENPKITVLGSAKVGNFSNNTIIKNNTGEVPNARIDFWESEITKDLESRLYYNSRGEKVKLID